MLSMDGMAGGWLCVVYMMCELFYFICRREERRICSDMNVNPVFGLLVRSFVRFLGDHEMFLNSQRTRLSLANCPSWAL
jgi:hypothetical protein